MKLYDFETISRLTIIFVVSFVLNFVWEHLHSILYVHYQGGQITNFILLKASLGDAFFLTSLSILFYRIPRFRANVWFIFPIAIVSAISLEYFALATGRWAYNDLMPLIPFIEVGVTPAIQLGILGFITLKIATWYEKKSTT